MIELLRAALAGLLSQSTPGPLTYGEANRIRSQRAAATRAERVSAQRRERARALRRSVELERGPIVWKHPL